ncbi:MAG: TetR/AcrR family transcriptional regulator [Candidatus Nanopelagicaceae bacterium]
MLSAFHPTKKLLVETVVNLLDSKKPNEILAEEVLEISGVSKGSMYHHFEDLQELVETAQLIRYSKWIDASIQFMTTYVLGANSRDSFIESLRKLTELTQAADRKGARAERALALAACLDNPRMAKAMGAETQRHTDALADIIREVQNRGLVRQEVDAKAVAVFIQSYTLGKMVNDYNPTAVPDDNWVDLITDMAVRTFVN